MKPRAPKKTKHATAPKRDKTMTAILRQGEHIVIEQRSGCVFRVMPDPNGPEHSDFEYLGAVAGLHISEFLAKVGP